MRHLLTAAGSLKQFHIIDTLLGLSATNKFEGLITFLERNPTPQQKTGHCYLLILRYNIYSHFHNLPKKILIDMNLLFKISSKNWMHKLFLEYIVLKKINKISKKMYCTRKIFLSGKDLLTAGFIFLKFKRVQ